LNINGGEFASLNNTSCNLASLNLLKFFSKNENNKIVFDYETFKDVIRTVITAQDILIDNSSYPNEIITTTTRKYRNLGLGYTNLGGLLMWLGMPYDSDEGRSCASNLTALMTGLAFEASADLADEIGSFEGFENNKTSMLRVLKLHYDHVNNLQNISKNNFIHQINQDTLEVWKKIIGKTKFRNAQISLLAPTGCLKKDSYIITSDGINEIQDLNPTPDIGFENIITEENKYRNINLKILQENSTQHASKFYYNGIQDTIKIISEDGYQIEGTPNHKIRVITSDGDYVWKKLDEIIINDQLALRKGGHEELLENKPYIKLNIVPKYENEYHNRLQTKSPEYLDERLAFIIGCYMGDGTIHDKGLRFAMFNGDGELADVLEECFIEVFNIKNRYLEEDTGNSTNVYFTSKTCRRVFEINNFIKNKGNHGEGSASAFIPKQILQSKTSVLCAFLRGLFDTDGSIHITGNTPIVEYSTVSEKLARQLQITLLSLGIGTIVYSYNPTSGFKENRRKIFKIRISSVVDIPVFKNKIGFTCSYKSDQLDDYKVSIKRGNFLRGKGAWKDFRDHLGPHVVGNNRRAFHMKCSKKNEMGSLYWADDMIELYPQLKNSKIGKLLDKHILISRVEKIENSRCETLDISVPVNNTYIANGFVSHNTISFLMNAITTGMEPDYALVRYKRLSGSEGATLKTINPIVEESLRNLGYSEKDITLLIDELMGNLPKDTPSRFKGLDKEVFYTASPLPGTNLCIPYMGHIKMCAAIQPFISGAISKTINLPKDVTVDEIYNLYIESWKLGLKGVTIYRDGSKNFQPLSTIDETTPLSSPIKIVTKELVRKKLPDERPAITHKFKIGNSDGYITCGMYNDGSIGEIFVNVSKEGSVISGFADALATVLSISLQYGVPLKEYVRKLSHLKFEPSGFTSNSQIRTASSIVDYIARYIGLKFLSEEDQIELGLISQIIDDSISNKISRSTTDNEDGPVCPNCGAIMRKLGSCHFCANCSYNSGSCG
jgi:ribonucleoside-diphosphate reductase alpha chain